MVETTRKAQTENLLKIKKFFNLNVNVSEHKTLNTSKGIIKDRTLKGETEANICEYLQNQGVIAVKRFTIKKPRSDSTTVPWSLGHTSHLGTILTVILVPIRECKE